MFVDAGVPYGKRGMWSEPARNQSETESGAIFFFQKAHETEGSCCAESTQRTCSLTVAAEFAANLPGLRMILRMGHAAAFVSPIALAIAGRHQHSTFPADALLGCNSNCYPCWASPFAPRGCFPWTSAHGKHQPARGRHQRKSCSRLDSRMMVATTAASLPGLDSPAGAALASEGLKPQEWTALLKAGELISLEQEQLLISQGDVYENPEDREVYLLLQGECRIEVRGKGVGQIGPGEFVGEGETCPWEERRLA